MEKDTSSKDGDGKEDTYLGDMLNSISVLPPSVKDNVKLTFRYEIKTKERHTVQLTKTYLREANALPLSIHVEIQNSFDKYFYCAELMEKKIPQECLEELTINLIHYMMHFEKTPPNKDSRNKLLCPICDDIFLMPKTMTCGHTFCEKCIRPAQKCPICLAEWIPTKKDSLQVDVLIKRLVAKAYPEESANFEIYLDAVNKFQKGDWQHGRELCKDGLKKSPNNERFTLLLSEMNYRPHEVEKQLLEVFNTPRRACGLSQLFYTMAKRYVKQEKYEDALVNYCIAIRLNIFLARTYYSELVPELQKILHNYIKPKSQSYTEKLDGPTCERTGKPKFILRRYDQIRSTLARIYMQVNKLKDAEKKLPKVEIKAIHLSDFECCICSLILYEPIVTTCGHTFCSVCLKFATLTSFTCPYCRKDLAENLFSSELPKPTELIVSIIRDKYPSQFFTRFVESRKLISTIVSIPALPNEKITIYEHEPAYDVLESITKDYGCFVFVNRNLGTVLNVHSNLNKTEPQARKKIILIGSMRVRLRKIHRNITNWPQLVEYDRFGDRILFEQDEVENLNEIHSRVHDKITSWFSMLPDNIKDDILKGIGEMPEIEPSWSRMDDGPAWHWWAISAIIRTDLVYATHRRLKEKYLMQTSLTNRLLDMEKHVDLIDQGVPLRGFQLKERRNIRFRDRSVSF